MKIIDLEEVNGVYVPVGETAIRSPKPKSCKKAKTVKNTKIQTSRVQAVPRPSESPAEEFVKGIRTVLEIFEI